MENSTKAIRSRLKTEGSRDHSSAIHMTSSFRFENSEEMRAMFAEEIQGNVYSRYANPSVDEFIL